MFTPVIGQLADLLLNGVGGDGHLFRAFASHFDCPFAGLLIAFLFFLSQTGNCLKLTRVEVPTMVPMGEPFWLNCSYDLGNQGLYSIKWYHWNPDSSFDSGEFFRWVPNDNPPGQMFPMKGIHLDVSDPLLTTSKSNVVPIGVCQLRYARARLLSIVGCMQST